MKSLRFQTAAAWAAMVAGLFLASPNKASAQYAPLTLPEGYVRVQGDIITTQAKAAQLIADMQGATPTKGTGPLIAYAPSRVWPNRVVPYDFDPGVTQSQQAVFLAAMAAWQGSFPGVTTISFRPRSNESGYLHIVVTDWDSGNCGAFTDYVGYNGGVVTLKADPCAAGFIWIIAHELGHALGLWHEQARSDRTNYVRILANNIQSGQASQFAIASPQSTFGPYDYDSIMHYFACEFSICPSCNCSDATCTTIQVVPQYYGGWQCGVGQQTHLSAMDQRGIAFMYAPANWKFLYYKAGSAADGSFQQPYIGVAQVTASIPAYSTLWIGPGGYSAAGMTLSTPMTLKAAIPDLQLQSDGSLGPSPSGWATLQ